MPKMRLAMTTAFFLVAGVFAFGGPTSVAAQGAKAVPDFAGLWTRSWKDAGTFDAPPSGQGPILIDPAHPRTPRNGQTANPNPNVTSDPWVADLSNPILKPGTRAKLKAISDAELAGNPHLESQTMCLPPGVPSILNLRDEMQILQRPNEVVILYSRDHWARHVYLNQPHSKNPGHTWFGESVGHYDGDTLVIDTIGENDKTHSDRFGTPHSERIHIVERYWLAADRKRLNVLFTVDDPGAFTMPWSARADYRPDDWFFEENVCAENNRSTGPAYEIPLPVADKPDF
jgi:hypothetical protein